MTREHAKELLPIITAFANGEDIQYFDSVNGWLPNSQHPEFSQDPSRYRIAPKPRKVWVNFFMQPGGLITCSYYPHDSREQADASHEATNRIACHELELPPLP